VAIATGTLPQLTLDVLDYVGRRAQGNVQEELMREGVSATVGYECDNIGITFRISNAAITHTLRVEFAEGSKLAAVCSRASGQSKTEVFDSGSNVMSDPETVADALGAHIGELIEWITGDSI
jgi:hypothetical protein